MARYALTERKGKAGGSQSGDTSESASGQLIAGQGVAGQENKEAGLDEEDDETEAPKKAKAPAKTKKGGRPAKKDAAAEKDDEPIDTEEAAAEEEKPTESKKKSPPGKKPQLNTSFFGRIRDLEEDEEAPKKTRGRKLPFSIRDPEDDEEAPPALKKGRPSTCFRPPEAAFNIAQIQMPTPSSTQIQSLTANQPSKLYESLNDKEYHDVIFTAAGGTKITTYRCVLSKYSSIFRDIFKKNIVLPCRISLNDYSSATIQVALDFMFEKRDSIIGKEAEVFKFAAKYGIRDILAVCLKQALTSITPSNVCEYIQIAYSNNFEELKQKCLKVLVEKKKEVDPSKFAKLPENILMGFARF